MNRGELGGRALKEVGCGTDLHCDLFLKNNFWFLRLISVCALFLAGLRCSLSRTGTPHAALCMALVRSVELLGCSAAGGWACPNDTGLS